MWIFASRLAGIVSGVTAMYHVSCRANRSLPSAGSLGGSPLCHKIIDFCDGFQGYKMESRSKKKQAPESASVSSLFHPVIDDMYHARLPLLLLAVAGIQAQASTARRFTLQRTYDATNFFDQFNFRDVSVVTKLLDDVYSPHRAGCLL